MNEIFTDKQIEQFEKIAQKREELANMLNPFIYNREAIGMALEPENLEKMGANPNTLSMNTSKAFFQMLQTIEAQFYELDEQYKSFKTILDTYNTEINNIKKDDWLASQPLTQQRIVEITQKYKQMMQQIEAQGKTIAEAHQEYKESQPSISSMFK